MQKISDTLEKLVSLVATAIFLSMLILLFLQVILRYGFNSGFSWVEEYSDFCFVWLALLGIALGVKRNAHLALDALTDMLPGKLKRLSRLINVILCMVFYVLMMYSGIAYTKVGGMLTSPILRLKYSYMYISIPVVCGICLIFLVASLVTDKKEGNNT